MSAPASADICLLPWQLAHQGAERCNGPHSGVSRTRRQLSTRPRYITNVTPALGPGVSCGVPAKLLSQASDRACSLTRWERSTCIYLRLTLLVFKYEHSIRVERGTTDCVSCRLGWAAQCFHALLRTLCSGFLSSIRRHFIAARSFLIVVEYFPFDLKDLWLC